MALQRHRIETSSNAVPGGQAAEAGMAFSLANHYVMIGASDNQRWNCDVDAVAMATDSVLLYPRRTASKAVGVASTSVNTIWDLKILKAVQNDRNFAPSFQRAKIPN
jgi:hypothetical protein